MKSKFSWLFYALLVVTLVMAGCSGDDGDDGAPGATGPEGPAGPAGPVTMTNESCNVCHGEDQMIGLSINTLHPLVDPKIVINGIIVTSAAGAADTVTFKAFEKDGTTAVTGLTLADFRFYIADMVPANTPTANLPVGTWSTAYPERWLYESSAASTPTGVLTEAPAGTYTYAFVADLALGGTDAPEFDITHTQRLMIRAGGTDDLSREAAIADFTIPADGASTAVLSQDENTFARAIVVQQACTNCHGDPLQSAAHGASYQTPQGCVICHTPIGTTYGDEMQADGAWLASLIHNIHSANADRTAWDWSEVTYPQNISDCLVCHFDDGQALADNWKTNPSKEACSTCHDLPAGHETIPNNLCSGCHAPSGTTSPAPSVTNAHAVVYDRDNLLYNVTIKLSPDANADGVYEVGEKILVTATTDYAGFDYTNTNTAFLRSANLYVYGPRALALPVLTPGSTTDPAYVPPTHPGEGTPATQGVSMLVSAQASDPNNLTDASGFKYQLLEVTEDMANGTYMVQTNIDFSATGDRTTDGRHIGPRYYPLDGWELVNFQVGTATVSPKQAGECTSCHQQKNFSTYAHRSYFGTDGCLACHDQSGNHADPLTNRVHAVHAANTEGDLTNVPGEPPSRVWDEITFPRNLNASCAACHNSGNDSYRKNPEGSWGFACVGCHGGVTEGAYDHMLQNGAPFPVH